MSSSSDGYHAHSRAANLAADPRSVLGSGALRSCQQPGLAPPLARGDYVEIGERDGELAGAPMSQRCCVTVASLPASGTFCVRRPTRQARTPGIAGGGTAITTGREPATSPPARRTD